MRLAKSAKALRTAIFDGKEEFPRNGIFFEAGMLRRDIFQDELNGHFSKSIKKKKINGVFVLYLVLKYDLFNI